MMLEFGEMIVFAFAREHVQIEQPQRFAGGGVGHGVELQIGNPLVGGLDLLEFQAENALVNA